MKIHSKNQARAASKSPHFAGIEAVLERNVGMPEKPVASGLDKCNKCSTSRADDRPGYNEPSPTTHADICCLYRLANPGQSNAFLSEKSLKLRYCGRCKDCPALKAHKQELVDLANNEPPRSSSLPPQEAPLAPGLGSPTKKRKKIEPRLRQGFKKFTLEIRPERFKKKLWFGTYSADEIDRAQDAVNFYMGCNQPYTYADSPRIFALKPLKGIKFTDLHPNCEDEVEVDGHFELKYKYFARQVRDVIHAVMGKQKKASSKRNKNKEPADEAPTGGDPTMPGPPDTLTWDPLGIQYSSPELLTYEETLQIAELLRSHNNREDTFTLAEMFAFSPADHTFGYGEPIPAEEDDFPLWIFQNDDLSRD